MKEYYIYILSTKFNKMIYIWVTNNLQRRLYEHENKLIDWFTKKYNINKLVYYESCNDINEAIRREKELKWRTREKKNNLINGSNKKREDLSKDWT